MYDLVPCPYCASIDDCPHLLLYVDKTFRAAVGGSLMDVFNEHWFEICEAGGDDFHEREPFDDLLVQVQGLADDFNEYDVLGGPGSVSQYAVFFSVSEYSKMTSLQLFSVKILAS